MNNEPKEEEKRAPEESDLIFEEEKRFYIREAAIDGAWD